MPENDLEELAENFFCHMHDHSHGQGDHGHTDLTDELNPMRNVNKLRRSVLSSRTFFILNSNHVLDASIFTDDMSNLLCSRCSHVIGYKSGIFIRKL